MFGWLGARLIKIRRKEEDLATPTDVHAGSAVDVAAEPVVISELASVMTHTLSDGGMDRMTDRRVEELLAVPALTAHI
jgi:hypothetical protein